MNGLWWKISIKMKNHLNRFRMTTSQKIRYCEKLLTTLDGMFLLDPSTWMILTYSSPRVWYPVKSTTMEWSRRHQIHLRIEIHFLCLHWEMKGHWSVTCKSCEALRIPFCSSQRCPKCFSKIYTQPVSFHFPLQTNKCTSILIFMLKWQITPKNKKKSWSHDRYLSLENKHHGFFMLHHRRMASKCKYRNVQFSYSV